MKQHLRTKGGKIFDATKVTKLYTKQGRDYILVAEKIVGEWRVL